MITFSLIMQDYPMFQVTYRIIVVYWSIYGIHLDVSNVLVLVVHLVPWDYMKFNELAWSFISFLCLSSSQEFHSACLYFCQKLEDEQARKESFEKIYEQKKWFKNMESESGSGSTIEHTRQMVSVLHSVTDHLKKVLGQHKISFLDSSCGDMNWMPDFLNNRTDVEFHGYDITQTNIDKHKKKFRDKQWTFKVRIFFWYFLEKNYN